MPAPREREDGRWGTVEDAIDGRFATRMTSGAVAWLRGDSGRRTEGKRRMNPGAARFFRSRF